MNKSIAALWRGSDLSTLSARAEGASLQGEEMDMLEQSAAEDISETLHEQIDRFVIQWHFGVGTEPLARFALVPVSRPDVDKEIAINEHLVRHGAKLSIADECQRFGRRQVDGAEADRAMEAPAGDLPDPGEVRSKKEEVRSEELPSPGNSGGGLPGLGKSIANELPISGKNAEELPKKAPGSKLPGDPIGKEETAFARALQKDLRPVAKALQAALARGEGPGELKRRLERILQECGTESAGALEEAMKAAGALPDPGKVRSKKEEARSEDLPMVGKTGEELPDIGKTGLANVIDRNGREHVDAGSPEGGRFLPKGGTDAPEGGKKYTPATKEAVEKFKADLPKEITPEEFDSLLTAGFDDTDGEGNTVKYGTLLRDHIDDGIRNEQDRDARKKRLGMAVKMVRQSAPRPTGTDGKPAERVYAGIVDGNAFVAVADEHNEIDALEMVSYRRGKRKEVRNAQSDARTHSPSNVPTDPRRVRPIIEQPAPEGKEETR